MITDVEIDKKFTARKEIIFLLILNTLRNVNNIIKMEVVKKISPQILASRNTFNKPTKKHEENNMNKFFVIEDKKIKKKETGIAIPNFQIVLTGLFTSIV